MFGQQVGLTSKLVFLVGSDFSVCSQLLLSEAAQDEEVDHR